MFHTTSECKFSQTSAKVTTKKPAFKPTNKTPVSKTSRPASALFPQRNNRDRRLFPKRDSKEIGPCWNCHEMGHLQKDCPRTKKAVNLLNSCEESSNLLSDLFQTKEEEDAVWRVLANMDRICHNCLRSPGECQGSCKRNGGESAAFLAAAESVREKITKNPDVLTMFTHAYEQVDSSETSGVGAATAHAFLTETEGQDGTDEVDTNDTNELENDTTDRHSEGSVTEQDPPDVSFDTDTGSNLQEHDMSDEDDNEGCCLDQFFTRFEEEDLTPCTNVGMQIDSELYQELHRVSEGKPLWQHNAALLKSTAGGTGRIAVGEASVLVPQKDAQPTWQARMVYLDSCGSFPLVQEKELHGVKDAS